MSNNGFEIIKSRIDVNLYQIMVQINIFKMCVIKIFNMINIFRLKKVRFFSVGFQTGHTIDLLFIWVFGVRENLNILIEDRHNMRI